MTAEELVGAWRLTRFRVAFSDGRSTVEPMGPEAKGLLIYSAGGQVSAVLTRAVRSTLGVGGLEGAHRASADAKAEAFDGYMSYAGRWHLEGDEVVHTVEMSLTPDAVGLAQRRRVRWDGHRLSLAYDLTARSGVVRHYRLDWVRA